MRKFIQQKLKNQKGLTLIELLAVIVILAIIAAIAIPAIGNIIQNSRHNAVKADFQNALSAANLYFTENSGDATFVYDAATATNDETAGFLDDKGSLTGFTVTNVDGGANTIVGTAISNSVNYELKTADAATNDILNGFTAAEFLAASSD